jgi:hypothetical protein
MRCTLPDPCYRHDCPACYPEKFMDDMSEDPQSADGWTPDTSQGFPPDAAYEIGRALVAAERGAMSTGTTEEDR